MATLALQGGNGDRAGKGDEKGRELRRKRDVSKSILSSVLCLFEVKGLVCFVAPAGAWPCHAVASAAGERLLD